MHNQLVVILPNKPNRILKFLKLLLHWIKTRSKNSLQITKSISNKILKLRINKIRNKTNNNRFQLRFKLLIINLQLTPTINLQLTPAINLHKIIQLPSIIQFPIRILCLQTIYHPLFTLLQSIIKIRAIIKQS